MRYWPSRRKGCTPRLARRSKREVPRPSAPASAHSRAGGSCRWSPSRAALPPARRRSSGKRVSGSVTCPASSTRRFANFRPCMAGCSTALHVAHTTSAPCTISLSTPQSPGSPAGRPAALALPRRLCTRRSARDGSSLPTRTTLSPASAQPLSKLSTATLLSAVASTGPPPEASQSLTSSTAVLVFPTPGGPWTKVSRLLVAALSTWSCGVLAADSTSGAGW
mmetsp:Transcript_28256/g.89838  ORF Transcript_28256/g.89838 Transcript_28256/m.89838 type:complete len:222 (+) Transcript_28256:388-1053(+)